jgi:hypothetical protein
LLFLHSTALHAAAMRCELNLPLVDVLFPKGVAMNVVSKKKESGTEHFPIKVCRGSDIDSRLEFRLNDGDCHFTTSLPVTSRAACAVVVGC